MLGLFSRELICGGAYYWKEFCVSKWVGLDNRNSLKHYENSLKQLAQTWAYIGEGFIGRLFASEIGGAYFREGLLLLLLLFIYFLFFGEGRGGVAIGILRYVNY